MAYAYAQRGQPAGPAAQPGRAPANFQGQQPRGAYGHVAPAAARGSYGQPAQAQAGYGQQVARQGAPGGMVAPGMAAPGIAQYTPRVPGQPPAYQAQRSVTPTSQARRQTAQPGMPGQAQPPQQMQRGAPAVGGGQRGYGTPAAAYAMAAPQGGSQVYQQQAGSVSLPQQQGYQQQQPPANSAQIIQTVQALIENRQELKNAVVKAFKKAAGTGRTVDIGGLIRIRTELSKKLGIPEHIFGTIEDEYIRFDFDGSGFLEANEVYKLVKWHLYEFFHSSGNVSKNNLPTKSLQEAGYTTSKELGAGNQAVLKLACDRYGNQRCVKCYKKGTMLSISNLADMQDEFETMQLLACKNIARTFEIFQDTNFVYMVNEVYWGEDLTKLESNAVKNGVQITEDWWRQIFQQCFEALQFMHQQAMMHCDIKEPNLMLRTTNFANPQVVLIDFGVSKAMTAKDTGSVSGTPGYMPPETMNTGKWYPGGDIFSMGVAMMQLLTRRVPDEDKARQGIMIGIFLEGCRDIEGVKQAVNTRQPPFHLMPPEWPGLRTVVMRCLEKNLRQRPKAPTILKDPWFGIGIAQRENTAVEKAMMPQHPLATCGITDEMLQNTSPMTMGEMGDPFAMGDPGAYAPVQAAYAQGGYIRR